MEVFMNEIVKRATLLLSLLIIFMISAIVFLDPVFASDPSMSITMPSSSEEDEEIIFDIVAPYEMAEQQGGLPEPVPLETPLTVDPNDLETPGTVPMPGTIPFEAREDDQPLELSDDIGEPIPLDPPSLPFTDQGVDLTVQEPAAGDQVPQRPDGNWMVSAWVLIILLVLMIAAFLIYIATTDGKWPVIKPGEKKTKKKKSTK